MEFTEVIKKRRSIRRYLTRSIPQETLTEIIQAGTLAPSAHHKQPWEIVVVKEGKQRIAQLMQEFPTDDESIQRSAHTIERCDTLLLIYCNDFRQWEYNLLSMGAMIENMLLAATNLNIGSVWIGNVCPVEKEIAKILGLSFEQKRLVSAVALGYFDYWPQPLDRKKVLEITTYLD